MMHSNLKTIWSIDEEKITKLESDFMLNLIIDRILLRLSFKTYQWMGKCWILKTVKN